MHWKTFSAIAIVFAVRAMASAFRKLAALEHGGGNPLTASHPDPDSRADRMLAKAAGNGSSTAGMP